MPDHSDNCDNTNGVTPATGVPRRFYLRERNGIQRRDQKVRRLAQKVKAALPWLEDADAPAVRAFCEFELLASAAFAELRDEGMLTSDGNPKALLDTFRKLRLAQLQFERELGMTPAARMAIKANGTRAALDLAAQLATQPSDESDEQAAE
jgi:phage terminase small subunit